jgi:hypothetical protein
MEASSSGREVARSTYSEGSLRSSNECIALAHRGPMHMQLSRTASYCKPHLLMLNKQPSPQSNVFSDLWSVVELGYTGPCSANHQAVTMCRTSRRAIANNNMLRLIYQISLCIPARTSSSGCRAPASCRRR